MGHPVEDFDDIINGIDAGGYEGNGTWVRATEVVDDIASARNTIVENPATAGTVLSRIEEQYDRTDGTTQLDQRGLMADLKTFRDSLDEWCTDRDNRIAELEKEIAAREERIDPDVAEEIAEYAAEIIAAIDEDVGALPPDWIVERLRHALRKARIGTISPIGKVA